MITRRFASCVLLLTPFLFAVDTDYRATVAQWREAREAKLKAPDGWLAVAGLFWLKPGSNTFGGKGSAIELPRVSARLGSFEVNDGGVTLVPEANTGLLLNGRPAQKQHLKTDKDGEPDQLTLDKLTFFVIKRGPRLGIRLRDQDSEFRREFTHLNWYPVQSEYKLTGDFEPYPQKKRVSIDTIIGEPDLMWSPGKVTFQVQGQTVSLEPVEGEGKLWFIFKDATSGKTT